MTPAGPPRPEPPARDRLEAQRVAGVAALLAREPEQAVTNLAPG
jgi:hypothetical protein